MYYIAVYDTGKGNPSQTIHLLNTIIHELEFEYIIDSYTSDQELIQAIRTNPLCRLPNKLSFQKNPASDRLRTYPAFSSLYCIPGSHQQNNSCPLRAGRRISESDPFFNS